MLQLKYLATPISQKVTPKKRDTYLRTEPKKGGTDLRMEPVIQSMVTAEESNIDRLKYTLNEQKGPGS